MINNQMILQGLVTTSDKKKVAIMQPTYLPWIGYFGLMKSVDCFVLLDSVQFAKRSWQQRNQIKTHTGTQWLTVPVLSKGKRDQLICDVRMDSSRGFLHSHLKALEINYRKAAFFDEVFPLMEQILSDPPEKLVELNILMINLIREVLSIRTPLLRSSEMRARGENALLLSNICSELGADEYVSPPGSKVYLDESDAFHSTCVSVKYFNFHCQPYPQLHGDFVPYLSAADLILNCGGAGQEVVTKGIF